MNQMPSVSLVLQPDGNVGIQSTLPRSPTNDLVIIGNSGADFGARGFVTAYDQATGEQRWRFYTVPGDPSKAPDGEASDSVMPMAGSQAMAVGLREPSFSASHPVPRVPSDEAIATGTLIISAASPAVRPKLRLMNSDWNETIP